MSRILGAHVSVAGGLHRAFERAEELRCDGFQIFVKNANRWKAPPLEEHGVERFTALRRKHGSPPIVAHGSYLLNLCATDDGVLARTRIGLVDELDRVRRLGLDGLVIHPGAHLGEGEESGIAAIAASLDEVLENVASGSARVLLETTAGQGTVLGHRLEQIEAILEATRRADEIAVCLDSCHLLAAGYPVDSPGGVGDVLDEVVARFGREKLACIHLNDSKHPRGSRKDRHENIGKGHVGDEPFRAWLAHPATERVPLIVETPLGDDRQGHRRDLERLRGLLP